jgi:hypothetical protein
MTRRIKIAFFTFLGLFIGSLIYVSTQYFTFKEANTIDISVVNKNIEHGDLVFRKGPSLESFTVYLIDKEKEFSHVGIVYILDDEIQIIHAVPTKNHEKEWIKMERLSTFLCPKNASTYAIIRPIIEAEQKQKVAQEAYQFYQDKVYFDNDYDMRSNDKLYCTELIIKAFNNSDIDIGNNPLTQINFMLNKHSILLPGTLLKNPSFKRIINN